jgi:hypothetical protein
MTRKNKKVLARIKANKHQINIAGLVKRLAVRGENKKECAEFVGKLVQELGPCTELEKLLSEKIIFLWWKLRRLFEIERIILSQQNKPMEKYNDWGDQIKKQRVRNLAHISIHSPQVREVIGQQIATEKALSKALEQYTNRNIGKNDK